MHLVRGWRVKGGVSHLTREYLVKLLTILRKERVKVITKILVYIGQDSHPSKEAATKMIFVFDTFLTTLVT